MFGNLYLFLDQMAFEDAVLEVTTKDGDIFTGQSAGEDLGEENMAWSFKKVQNWEYDGLFLKNIARVRRVGETEYAYIAEDELAVAS